MSRRHRWYSVAVLLLLVAVACGDSGDSATGDETLVVVIAEDGQLTLSVDPAALPEGVSPGDIRVRRLDPAEVDLPGVTGRVIAAYQLEPDGIEFSSPAILTTRLDLELGNDEMMEVQLVGSDGTQHMIEPVITTFDPENGSALIELGVTRFSTLVYSIRPGDFQIEWQIPDRIVVGVPFEAQARIKLKNPDGRRTFLEQGQRKARVVRRPWALLEDGDFFAKGFTPSWVKDRPPSIVRSMIASFTMRETFTCTKVGAGNLRYWGDLNYRLDEFDVDEDGDRTQTVYGRYVLAWILNTVPTTCEAAPPPTTTTSTTTTTVPDTTTTTLKVGAAGTRLEFFAEFAPAAGSAEDCTDFAEDMIVEFDEDSTGTLGFALELSDGLPGLPFTLDPDGLLIVDEVALPFDDVVFFESFSLDLVAGTGTYRSEPSDPDFGAACEFDVLFDPGAFDDQE